MNKILLLALSATIAYNALAQEEPRREKDPNRPISTTLLKLRRNLSRQALNARLAEIEKTEVPELRMSSAMCYAMKVDMDSIVHICPVCSNKTIYSPMTRNGAGEIKYYKRILEPLTDFDIKLDVSELCKKCYPNLQDRNVKIIIKLEAGKDSIAVKNFNYTDLQVLRDFLLGEIVYTRDNDEEEAMRYYVPRIRELLGLEKK